MSEKTAYEHGARELKPLTGPDPHDDFSQKAAENKPPRGGIGLTEPIDERSETDKSDLQDSGSHRPPSKPVDHEQPARDTHDSPSTNPGGEESEREQDRRDENRKSTP